MRVSCTYIGAREKLGAGPPAGVTWRARPLLGVHFVGQCMSKFAKGSRNPAREQAHAPLGEGHFPLQCSGFAIIVARSMGLATPPSGNEHHRAGVPAAVLPLVVRTVMLVLGGALLGLAGNALRPDGVSVLAFAPPVTCTSGPSEAVLSVAPPVRLVTQSEAALLCADATTLIADVRDAEAFAAGHVAGAIHLPCSASEKVAAAAETGLVRKQLMLVYGERTDDAFPVAEQMRQRLDRRDLRIGVLEGGFEAWSQAGLACTSGTCPQCGDKGHAEHVE